METREGMQTETCAVSFLTKHKVLVSILAIINFEWTAYCILSCHHVYVQAGKLEAFVKLPFCHAGN